MPWVDRLLKIQNDMFLQSNIQNVRMKLISIQFSTYRGHNVLVENNTEELIEVGFDSSDTSLPKLKRNENTHCHEV